jgi:hypothetical protein
MVIFVLLWGYFGRETLTLGSGHLTLSKSILGVGQRRKITLANVSGIRLEPASHSWWGGSRYAIWGLGPGKIKLDHGLRTHSFGLGVDDAEAKYLVALLQARLGGDDTA